MTNVVGDLSLVEKGIIVHQVNNRHKMGRGLALSLRGAFPCHYEDYMTKEVLELGHLVISRPSDGLRIIGTISQDGYGTDKRYSDYKAIEMCLKRIKRLIGVKTYIPVYFPYGYACGLAGGDWRIVEPIIKEYIPQATIVMFRKGVKI